MELEEIYDLWKDEFGEDEGIVSFADFTRAFNTGRVKAFETAIEIAQRLERKPYNSTQISVLIKDELARVI